MRAEVKGGKVVSMELVIGGQVLKLSLNEPKELQVVAEAEQIEIRMNELIGWSASSPLAQLWDMCSDYERAFLRSLAEDETVSVSDVLEVYRKASLKHSTGRILAGVTSGVTKKLKRLGIADLIEADYSGSGDQWERTWALNAKYAAVARRVFRP